MDPLNFYFCALHFVSALSALLGSLLLKFDWLTQVRFGIMIWLAHAIFIATLLLLTIANMFELGLRLYSGALFDKNTLQKDAGLFGAAISAWRRLKSQFISNQNTVLDASDAGAESTRSFNSRDMWRVPAPSEASRKKTTSWLKPVLRFLRFGPQESGPASSIHGRSMSHGSLRTQVTNESMFWIELSSPISTAPDQEIEKRWAA